MPSASAVCWTWHRRWCTKERSEEFDKLYSRLDKYEDISDRMEIEIANFLNLTAEGRLSNQSKLHVAAMLNIVSEIESIADACLGVGKILLRKQQSHAEFNKGDIREHRHHVRLCT